MIARLRVLFLGCWLLLAFGIAQRLQASPVICIDPGHPSETSAGANSNGLSENHLNWVVALQLRDALTARGIATVMTKSSEHELVTNRRRAEIANDAHAAMFIRLHCDVGSGQGFTWYYPNRSGHKYGVTGPPPNVCQASGRLAAALNASMIPLLAGSLRGNPVKTDAATHVGAGQGGVLTGSIFARVPTALIEMCYINRRNDAAFIASRSGQRKVASALASAIARYLARD